MSETRTPKLSELRLIGWRCWDPIGLASTVGHAEIDDEYDAYLRGLAVLLTGGATPDEAARYLMETEAGHMGLGPRSDAASRAEATVAAVRAYLASLAG